MRANALSPSCLSTRAKLAGFGLLATRATVDAWEILGVAVGRSAPEEEAVPGHLDPQGCRVVAVVSVSDFQDSLKRDCPVGMGWVL